MALNADEQSRQKSFAAIPENPDVLVTHSPAYGTLDRNSEGQNCGCEVLASQLPMINPRLHASGHVHDAAGIVQKYGRISVNACTTVRGWTISNLPQVIDLKI